MREILFRAKRIDNGEWVYGDLLHEPYGTVIQYDEEEGGSAGTGGTKRVKAIVGPFTICQYTGLLDKNGRKIFEGDIVKFRHGGEWSENGIYFRNYAVEFVNTFVTYGLRLRNKSIHFPFKQATASMHDAEVIGNIFDSPERLAQ